MTRDVEMQAGHPEPERDAIVNPTEQPALRNFALDRFHCQLGTKVLLKELPILFVISD